MKRSTQVSLVLMTAVGVGGIAYALTPDSCRPPPPSATANDAPKDCRTSRGSSGGHSFYSGSGSSSSNSSAPSSSSPSTSTGSSRGGFGSIGHAFASFGGS